MMRERYIKLNEIKDIEEEIRQISNTKVKEFLNYIWEMEKDHPETTFHYKGQYINKLKKLIREE